MPRPIAAAASSRSLARARRTSSSVCLRVDEGVRVVAPEPGEAGKGELDVGRPPFGCEGGKADERYSYPAGAMHTLGRVVVMALISRASV